MKIIITGSLGHISRPEKQNEIEALGAAAAIGSLEDVDFITATFTGADAVYSMVPPADYFDHHLDLLAHYHKIGNNYAQAIRNAEVKRIVNLSTIGGNLEKGSGILLGAHNVEQILNDLSNDVAITHMRPTSFYYNLYGYLDMIRTEGFIAANYGEDDVIPWVSPSDNAAAIAEELETAPAGKKVRYVASEELTASETAKILGTAIGKPDLKWIRISSEQMLTSLEAAGMNPEIAAGLVEMYGGLHSGLLAEDYYLHKPAVMGKVKLADFAREFAVAFNQNGI